MIHYGIRPNLLLFYYYAGALYRENDRNLPVKSSSAKLRMYTFLMIFIITGLVSKRFAKYLLSSVSIWYQECLFECYNYFISFQCVLLVKCIVLYILVNLMLLKTVPTDFILVCDSVEFVNEESSHPGSHVNNAKHREFAVLLLLQVNRFLV